MTRSMALTTAQRVAIIERDRGCARCGLELGPMSLHHRLPRRMGGTRDVRSSDPRNLVVVCGSGTTGCHGAIESNRTKAYAGGWLLQSYDDLDLAMVALDGRRIYLDADGGRTEEALTRHRMVGSLAEAIDQALAARRASLATKETP